MNEYCGKYLCCFAEAVFYEIKKEKKVIAWADLGTSCASCMMDSLIFLLKFTFQIAAVFARKRHPAVLSKKAVLKTSVMKFFVVKFSGWLFSQRYSEFFR